MSILTMAQDKNNPHSWYIIGIKITLNNNFWVKISYVGVYLRWKGYLTSAFYRTKRKWKTNPFVNIFQLKREVLFQTENISLVSKS